MFLPEIPLYYYIFGFGAVFAALSLIFGPRRVLKPIFGDIEPEELNKFILLGLVFGLILQ